MKNCQNLLQTGSFCKILPVYAVNCRYRGSPDVLMGPPAVQCGRGLDLIWLTPNTACNLFARWTFLFLLRVSVKRSVVYFEAQIR